MDPNFIFVLLATMWAGAPYETEKVGGYSVAVYDIEQQCIRAERLANETAENAEHLPTFSCLKLPRPQPVSGN